MIEEKHPKFKALNQKVNRISEKIAYLGAISMILICAIAFINVLTSKIIHWSIPENINWIGYLIIPAVYLAVPNVQLTRGLTNVDLFSRKFPKLMEKIIQTMGMVLGVGIYGFAAYRSYFLFHDYFVFKEMSAQSADAFVLWPFVVIYGVGTLLLTLSFIWKIPCIWLLENAGKEAPPQPEPDLIKEGSEDK